MTQTDKTNRQLTLAERPKGAPDANTLRLIESPLPVPASGQMLLRTEYLSLDPYMRGRMSDAPSYAAPVGIGQPMVGHTVSQVVESKNQSFAAGDIVAGYDGWREYGVSKGTDLRKLNPTSLPISTAIGVLG